MIFAHTLSQVIQGEKQQTRRLIKDNEVFDSEKRAIIKSASRVMYQVGKSYAVQPGRGKKSVARILMTAIRKEHVGLITQSDALYEGFKSRDDFLATWYTIHGNNADLNSEVWVFEFKLQTILNEDIEALYGSPDREGKDTRYRKDLSCSIEEVPGNSMYSGNYRERGMDTSLPNRLSVFTR